MALSHRTPVVWSLNSVTEQGDQPIHWARWIWLGSHHTLTGEARMPQNEHIELFQKRHGLRFDYHERQRKKEARAPKERARKAKDLIGLPAKLYAQKLHKEKILMKKTIAMHEQKDKKRKADDGQPQNAVPAYLLERDQVCSGSTQH